LSRVVVGAISELDRAVLYYGVNATLLDALGKSYLGLRKPAERPVIFEKSLQISLGPLQIKNKVDELKKK
jgi:hypothetical protein